MITGRDPTPEEREKTFRAFRTNALTMLAMTVLYLGMAVFSLTHGRKFGYAELFVGVFGIVVLTISWSRLRRYRV